MHLGASGFELGTDGPTVILAGVDGSRTSLRAVAYAAGLARRQRAHLVVAYVGTVSSYATLRAELAVAAIDARRALAEELRQQIVPAAAALGLDIEFITADGDPYNQLIRLADEVRAELLVVGASESTGHRLAGSLAVRLVRAGRWPVTVVP